MSRTLVIPAFLWLAAGVCVAREYWVASGGNDADDGTTGRPLRTIQRAVDFAKAGDTVLVSAGRYEEHVGLVAAEKSGAADRWLTIAAADGDERRVVVGTEKPLVDAYGGASTAFSLQDARFVRLRGFKCVAAYRGRGAGIGLRKCEHVEVLNCEVSGGGQGGVDANECDFITIDGVEAYFNGGDTGWSSGISLFEPRGPSNIIRNCVCYGNFDNSAFRSDGNGIIVDNGYGHGGALLANNLCYMNGGKGICSTRSDHCTFLNNTCAMNCWQPNQQESAHELSVRGADNVVRNNIGVGAFRASAGMQVLLQYSGPGGDVRIDPAAIRCDHNLFFSPAPGIFAVLAGDRRRVMTLEEMRKDLPQLAADSLCLDPGFVDLKNLDFRLRSDSPAVRAGRTDAGAPADRLGKRRGLDADCSLGCYEGGYAASDAVPSVKAGVTIAAGEDEQAIAALLGNVYDLEWHGMLWGWGRLLTEELPLEIDVQGPRRADFVNLEGAFVLRDLLERIAREHQVRLVLRQPPASRGLPTGPFVINHRLMIADKAAAEDRAFVRHILRACVWTQADKQRLSLAELLPALSAATGLRIESNPALSIEQKFVMITRNMPLGAFLTDLADRMNVRLTLAKADRFSDPAKVQTAELGKPFGGADGLAEVTVEQPDPRGRVDLFARVRPDSCLCARAFTDNCRMISPAGIDDTKAGALFHKADTRLERSSVLRLAVKGDSYAVNVGGTWLLAGRIPPGTREGPFLVRAVSPYMRIGNLRFVPL